MINESAAVSEEAPIRGEWITDGMAAVQSVSPKDTWGEYADSLLGFCMPPKMFNLSRLVIIMDTYGKDRIKGMIQKRRGHAGRKAVITEKGQSMPNGKDWNPFLQSGENKTELINFLANHYMSDSLRSKLDIPLVFTESNNTWMITAEDVLLIEKCNRHEADTRVVQHASLSERPVVIDATDTDIFILLVYAFSKVTPTEKWYMKIDKEWYLQSLWEGNVWCLASLSQCDRMWHNLISIQSRKSEAIQEIGDTEQVYLGVFGWNSSELTSTTQKHAYLHAQ